MSLYPATLFKNQAVVQCAWILHSLTIRRDGLTLTIRIMTNALWLYTASSWDVLAVYICTSVHIQSVEGNDF